LTETTSFKYRAFLSYSHRDKAWGKWLHAALEGYAIDKELVERETPRGPIPKTLRPIFRDREEFAAGPSLSEQTLAALEASQLLVVICSPNAARNTPPILGQCYNVAGGGPILCQSLMRATDGVCTWPMNSTTGPAFRAAASSSG
jgi:hypothetical protein